ncbi:MAG: acyltransferase [Oliverpabstia sp.]
MKPYLKLIYNKIRLIKIHILNRPIMRTQGIQLFGYNTKLVFHRNSCIFLDDRIISDGRCVLIVDENATLKIGNHVYFNEGMMISCKAGVEIGEGCQFGPNVKIFDNNHCFDAQHGVLPEHTSASIHIGRHCWIAANVTILKGAEIGDNCIIGAGCVIKQKIPAYSIVTQSKNLNIRQIQGRK